MRYLNPNSTVIYLCILFFSTNVLFAHGELAARIKEKTSQISKDPKNAELYFKRGILYYQHKEFNKAVKDYNKAEKLGKKEKFLFYHKAEVYRSLKRHKKALNAIEIFFTIDAKDVKIHKLKAQVLMDLEKFDEALIYYNYVLEKTIDLRPEDIVEYCNILLAKDSKNIEGALVAIELGLEKLGQQTITLRLKKIEYLKLLQKNNEVINEYNSLILSSKRKENWYYEKAIFLNSLNKTTEVMISLQQAKISIQELNPKFRQTSSIKKLITKIKELESSL